MYGLIETRARSARATKFLMAGNGRAMNIEWLHSDQVNGAASDSRRPRTDKTVLH